MMGCGMFSNGYAEYRCSCGHIKKAPLAVSQGFASGVLRPI